jgi:hypothetical protein
LKTSESGSLHPTQKSPLIIAIILCKRLKAYWIPIGNIYMQLVLEIKISGVVHGVCIYQTACSGSEEYGVDGARISRLRKVGLGDCC